MLRKSVAGMSSYSPCIRNQKSTRPYTSWYRLRSGNTMIAHFIFKPNSRNFWHYHPDAEQTLLVLDGEGYYQEEGGEKRVIRKGDVIVTPPNVRHWNGATPGSSIVCMTVTEHAIENHAVQLRAVTDKEYN